MLFPTDPSLRKVKFQLFCKIQMLFQPRKRKMTEGIKRAAKIQKLSLKIDTEELLKAKLDQLGKELEGIEE